MPARGTATNRQTASNRQNAVGRLAASNRQFVSGGGGGGGSDLTNVSSLPSPGSASATTTYHLSKDDQLYILNAAGTALIPLHLPGWARRDGANDDEWEGSNVDPPSGWTWDNQDSTTVDTNNQRKSFTVLTKSNTADKLAVLYQNVPASPNKTYYSLFQWASDNKSSSSNSAVGLIARNNTSGRILFFFLSNSASQPILSVSQWLTSTSPIATVFSASIIPNFIPGMYGVLGMTFDGTSLSFKYSPLYNGAFENFVTVYSETLVAFIAAFDSFGIGIYHHRSVTTTLYSDWLRVV